MAKQRGTHQISGTINNLVYYEQKYVKGGLIRRQNEAMPARVKEDPTFSNTRLANSLFGGCMKMASALLRVAGRRVSALTTPSRNAFLAASVLRMYQIVNGISKTNGIDFDDYDVPSIIDYTDRVMKNPLYRFFPSFQRVYRNVAANSDVVLTLLSDQLQELCEVSGVSSVQIEVYGPAFISSIEKDITTNKYTNPAITQPYTIGGGNWTIGDPDFGIEIDSGQNSTETGFLFVIIMPVTSGRGAAARFKIKNTCAGFVVLKYV